MSDCLIICPKKEKGKTYKNYCINLSNMLNCITVANKCTRAKDKLTQMYAWNEQTDLSLERAMAEKSGYYVVKQRALPEVLLKVVEVKKMIDSERVNSIQEAVDQVGISRSSFYKYKDDIFPFHDTAEGMTINLTFQMDDEPGLLSDVLRTIAESGANILTIHQSIPINGVASLSLSIQILPTTSDVSEMIEIMEKRKGVHNVKIIAKE